jgi:hypothetical protein
MSEVMIDPKHLVSVECLTYLVDCYKMVEDAHVKLNSKLPWQVQRSPSRRHFFTSKLDLNIRKETVKCCIFGIALYGAEGASAVR